MQGDDDDALDREITRFERHVPRPIGRLMAYAVRPGSALLRYPLAFLLIAGGVLGFLPILGFWMVPFGLALVAQDIPFLRPPVARFFASLNQRFEKA